MRGSRCGWSCFLYSGDQYSVFSRALRAAPRERPADAEGAPWPGPVALSEMIPRSRWAVRCFRYSSLPFWDSSFWRWDAGDRAYGWDFLWRCRFVWACLRFCSIAITRSRLVDVVLTWRCSGGCAGSCIDLGSDGRNDCVLMAAPFTLGWRRWAECSGTQFKSITGCRNRRPAMLSIVLLLVPASFGIEHAPRCSLSVPGADGD